MIVREGRGRLKGDGELEWVEFRRSRDVDVRIEICPIVEDGNGVERGVGCTNFNKSESSTTFSYYVIEVRDRFVAVPPEPEQPPPQNSRPPEARTNHAAATAGGCGSVRSPPGGERTETASLETVSFCGGAGGVSRRGGPASSPLRGHDLPAGGGRPPGRPSPEGMRPPVVRRYVFSQGHLRPISSTSMHLFG